MRIPNGTSMRAPLHPSGTMVLLAILTAVAGPSSGQKLTPKPVTVLQEWTAAGIPHDGFTVGILSPDGSLEVHLGPRGFEDGLYLRNRITGKNKLVVEDAQGFKTFDRMSFSPDGMHILFHACPPVGAGCDSPRIYTVRTDGSDLRMIAEARYDEEARTDYRPESPIYSADGSKIIVELLGVSSQPGEDRQHPAPPKVTRYVGRALTAGEGQAIERLAEGRPLFWSTDGSSIYYAGKDGLARLDLDSRASIPVNVSAQIEVPLGKVPESDAMFFRNAGDKTIRVVSLDGRPTSPQILEFAANVFVRDADGRLLRSIRESGRSQLILNYELPPTSPNPGVAWQHVELVALP